MVTSTAQHILPQFCLKVKRLYVFRYCHFVNIITFYLKQSDVFIIICTKEYDNTVVTDQISISNTVDGIAISIIVLNCFDELYLLLQSIAQRLTVEKRMF